MPHDFVASVYHRPNRGNFLGSAVLIADRHAVTCAHVLRLKTGKLAQNVYLWFGSCGLQAEVVATEGDADSSPDLALLKLTASAGAKPAQWTDEVHVGDTLDLVGFNEHSQRSLKGKVTAPVCNAETGDLDEIQLESCAHHGMSGGTALHNHAGRDRCVGLIREGMSGGSRVVGEGAVARFVQAYGITLIPWRSRAAPPPVFDTTEYRAAIAKEFATIKPPGLPPGHDVNIDEIYIHLSSAGEHGPRPLEEAVATHPRLLVSGPAGSGKTTFLKRIAIALSRHHDEKIRLPFGGPAMFVRRWICT
jgi:hypothetical protein